MMVQRSWNLTPIMVESISKTIVNLVASKEGTKTKTQKSEQISRDLNAKVFAV